MLARRRGLGKPDARGYTGAMQQSLPYRLWAAFARGRIDEFDALVADDVVTNSPIGWDIRGRQALKDWARAFHSAFIAPSAPTTQIELVDLFDGGERAFLTVNLVWKHDGDFYGLTPTGRSGTSIETFILRVRDAEVTHWEVADHSLDLTSYLTATRAMPYPQNRRPPALATLERPGI